MLSFIGECMFLCSETIFDLDEGYCESASVLSPIFSPSDFFQDLEIEVMTTMPLPASL